MGRDDGNGAFGFEQPGRRRRPAKSGGSARRPLTEAAVNRQAQRLLKDFYRSNKRRYFEELIGLTTAPLTEQAHAITRELGLAIDPEQLVAAHFAQIFIDLRVPSPAMPRFLQAARAAMRAAAMTRLQNLQAGAALCAVAAFGEDAMQVSLGLVAQGQSKFQALFSDCFHGLSEDDRRLLLAADVDGAPLPALARKFKLTERMALRRLHKARGRLAAKLAAGFLAIESGGTDRMERS
ncbi:MAG: hypothetical protein ACT4PU_13835 [Planctomycetota bacterium]